MAKAHDLAIFTEAEIQSANGHFEWVTRWQHEGEWINDRTRDRRIVYPATQAEARIREDRYGHLDVLIFVWSNNQKEGIKIIETKVPTSELDTAVKRRGYLKRIVRYTERLSLKMTDLDSSAEIFRQNLGKVKI